MMRCSMKRKSFSNPYLQEALELTRSGETTSTSKMMTMSLLLSIMDPASTTTSDMAAEPPTTDTTISMEMSKCLTSRRMMQMTNKNRSSLRDTAKSQRNLWIYYHRDMLARRQTSTKTISKVKAKSIEHRRSTRNRTSRRDPKV